MLTCLPPWKTFSVLLFQAMKKNPIQYLLLCCSLALPAAFSLYCSPEKEGTAPLPAAPRIVSLSPSISRQIDDLGRREVLAGVTSYDDFSRTGIEIVGTLVQPNLEAIIRLGPDIVLLSSEDGPVQNIDRLNDAGVRVYRFGRNRNFSDICHNYLRLAAMLGKEPEARKNIARYSGMLDRYGTRRRSAKRGRPAAVAFFLSHRPLIAASEGSFIAQVIRDAGGVCVYSGTRGSYPPVSLESLVEYDPDVIIYMAGDDEGNDFFSRLSRDFRSLRVVKNGTFYIIDPDTIPYYTPADYVKSVERVAEILDTSHVTPPPRFPSPTKRGGK
ncbi:MAG TPA: ABC transporter substrate-binding protein [Spirochaetota bacterium]|nr:ABC transporter substrate-binding protein [Spirochaetota bacterium]